MVKKIEFKKERLDYLQNILNKISIKSEIINKINNILESENEKDKIDLVEFFKELEKLKNNSKNIYKKYGIDFKSKDLIIKYIIDNMNILFKNLGAKRLLNSGTRLDIDKLDNFRELENLFYTKKIDFDKQNIIGGSCNYFIVWFYIFFYKDILDSDENIYVNFELTYFGNRIKKYLPGSGNHGKMYFGLKEGKNEYLAENIEKFFYIGKNNDKKKEGKKFNNYDDYLKEFKKNENSREKFSFRFKEQSILILKNNIFYIFKYNNGEKESFYILLNKSYNREELKEKILKKIGKNKKNNYFIELFFEKNKIN